MIPLYCMVCTKPMPDKRRGKTCTPECQRTLHNAKRQERAGKVCRLCGRRRNKPRELDAVLGEHTAIAKTVGG